MAAFLELVGRDGLARASMARVAKELGLDRTTLHHYFPSRDELVAAAMEQVITAYRQQMDALVAEPMDREERTRRLLDHAFSEDFNDLRLSNVLDQFSRAAAEDPGARAQLRRAYRAFEDVVLSELEKHYPRAPSAEIRRVAYTIAQLSEGASAFADMGLGPGRVEAARETAEQLVRQLERTSR